MNIIYTYGGTAFHYKTLGGLESWRKTHISHSPPIVKTCSRPGAGLCAFSRLWHPEEGYSSTFGLIPVCAMAVSALVVTLCGLLMRRPKLIWLKEYTLPIDLLATTPLYWTVCTIEVFTFVPMLGAGGSYLSFVTGNISNLKLP